jgi:hypothetical protein
MLEIIAFAACGLAAISGETSLNRKRQTPDARID